MNSEETNACRYFGGAKVNGPVSASKAQTFKELIESRVKKPVKLSITKAQFWEMPKEERNKAKEVSHIVAATFRESPSKRQSDLALTCNLIFLDIDEEKNGKCPAAQFVKAPDSLAAALAPFAFAAYTTASSTSEKPRMRLVVSASDIPLNRYPDAVLDVAKKIGLKNVTPESKIAVQPMFLPTVFADQCPAWDDPVVHVELNGRAYGLDDLPAEIERPTEEEIDWQTFENFRPRHSDISLSVAKSALACVEPDVGYSEWISIAAALKHQFGDEQDEEAYQLFDSWSSKGWKYVGTEETRAKWNSLKRTPNGRAPITIGTVLKMAESAGWKKTRRANDKEASIPDFGPWLVHASELVIKDIPKRAFLLDRWLCDGDLGYIYAARGVGKTWMSMALLGAISGGQPLGAWRAGEKPCKVLYVDGEMPLELTKNRTQVLGLEKSDVTFLHHEPVFDGMGEGLNIAREDHRLGITRLMESKGFKVLVLDNLSALANGLDENKGDEYDPVKAWLLDLRRRKVTVIVIHHAGRSGLMRGHSKREDDCSWILELKNAKTDGDEGAKFTSHFAKSSRNTGDSMPDLLWHITTTGKRLFIKCEEAALDEFQQFIRHVFEGVEYQKEIAELMGKPEGTISKWAKRAVEEGAIRKDGKRLLPLTKPKTAEFLDAPELDEGW